MEKNFVDFDYLAERLYAIIRDGEHVNQLEAIRILLTMQRPIEVEIEVMPGVLSVKPQRKKIDDKLQQTISRHLQGRTRRATHQRRL